MEIGNAIQTEIVEGDDYWTVRIAGSEDADRSVTGVEQMFVRTALLLGLP